MLLYQAYEMWLYPKAQHDGPLSRLICLVCHVQMLMLTFTDQSPVLCGTWQVNTRVLSSEILHSFSTPGSRRLAEPVVVS